MRFGGGNEDLFDQIRNADYAKILVLALIALDKQKPTELEDGKCPRCDLETSKIGNAKYCPNCGQRLEWVEK